MTATHERLIAHAEAIAGNLLDEADQETVASITWHRGYGVDYGPVPDAGIFKGRIGEALFFAAMHMATRNSAYEDASLRASHVLRSGLSNVAYREALPGKIGLGLTGVGSIVYALVRIAGFLDRPELLDNAKQASASLSPERIRQDVVGDVFWGSAGALLGLLSLHDATGTPETLVQATTCGEHLLARRVVDAETGLRAWGNAQGVPCSGFAHGSSGIAHALLQLHRRTGESRFYDAAMESFAFERTLFREEVMDWPDTRNQSTTHNLVTGWCHGAPGIALSRLSALPVLREEHENAVVRDLDLALTRSSTYPLRVPDHVCCGNFGRIDILLEAGLQLQNDSLIHQAHRLAAACLEQVETRGYAVARTAQAHELHMGAGLWQGFGGIGYTLLRLSEPGRYPCILAWE